tara:strand:+ start:770 stop:955 length:186 start_codon:yes stop_codon:yes gene_type:complete
MKLDIDFYLILVLCLVFASIFIYNGLKLANREGMTHPDDNADKPTTTIQPTKKKVKTVSPQ